LEAGQNILWGRTGHPVRLNHVRSRGPPARWGRLLRAGLRLWLIATGFPRPRQLPDWPADLGRRPAALSHRQACQSSCAGPASAAPLGHGSMEAGPCS